jgi:anthraniloyl-CoA monooxygenase
MYSDDHELAWKRLVDFVHAETDAKIAIQLGHSGPKGSTQLGWEQSDTPLPESNWEIVGASAVPWSPENQMPRALSRAEMDTIRKEFVRSAEMAARIGFDWLELHYAHGYLMSSFITPLSNKRTDEYGGSLANRMRFPLEVFSAVRKAWPDEKPISVRISAHDWVGVDGIQAQDAVEIARLLAEAGVDLVDVSAGQTSTHAQPVYGRMFQTPFSDQIRNEAGIATLAVGNIYEPDHVNSILMAGRADLVCLARPHLTDPYWTLHAAAELGYTGVNWPKPYWPGRDQLNRLKARRETYIGKV